MGTLILGLGVGLFSVVVAVVISIFVTLFASYSKPRIAPLIGLASLVLPTLVFGFFAAAPTPADEDSTAIIDQLYPARVALMVILILATLLGFAAGIGLPIAMTPKFVAPRVMCRRKEFEQMHPTWIK